ncbi:MAG TPA: hypothetical protein IGS53_29240 [Leptolyngbyaceae cyanobacterium M33_DOE_097]|uniref:Uncharacterized protein n=1 Tax=Oscillatoriales cyanobacterium SpSt-418 TaxID=2282169 RepID=A0A7C3KC55_9CYAN|nr:hypothetical protein [Leptolyngbyaceae cyanobacterium M33_DOE_097]
MSNRTAAVNQETWNDIVKFYYEDEFFFGKHWQSLAPLRHLVKKIAASERAKKFRAGQSMFTLCISTTPYHGLKEKDPFVCVDVLRSIKDEAPGFEIAYWSDLQCATEKHVCSEENALEVLDQVLDKLWRATEAST